MKRPTQNPDGYEKAAVSDVTGFRDCKRFLVMHGVADDNVHLQHTLSLISKLNQANIHNYDVQIFPDSGHNINFGNAQSVVYTRRYPPQP